MKHRVSKGLFCLILAGAMLLAGCSGGAGNASEEQLPVNASESSDRQEVLPSSDQESGGKNDCKRIVTGAELHGRMYARR